MDRLIKLDPSNIVLIRVEEGQKCLGKITLNNVMYTMPVAFRIQPLIKTRYTIKPQSGIISPLASLVIEITYHPPQQGSNNLPHSFPFSDDSFLLHSVLAPGAAIKEPSSMFDSVPSDWFTTKKKQVFIDSAIKVMFVGSQILTQLVEDGNSMDDIREVLEKSDPLWESVNSKDSQGQTLLHLAISKTRPDLVQLILEFKPDIEATNSVGSTPLEAASSSGESLIVELLLAHKANTEGSESSVFRPIHHASREGHMEILRLLLLKGARVDSLTKDGNTSLHLAVEEKRRDCARLLLANGARTDVRNMREGDTPLHIAAANGDENMVKLLLHKGATKYVRNKLGKTAFDVAAENGHSRLFDALRLGDNLCAAARKGEVRTIQKVLESGGVINGRDQNGWTSLHRAAFKGRMDAVRFLVEKGIDLDAKDEDGYTALHCAAESGHADVTEFLVKKGADVEARTNKGVSALQIVESLNYVGITRILVNGGASREGLATPRGSSFNQTDFYAMFQSKAPSPKHGYTNSFQSNGNGDIYSMQSSKGATPRTSNFEDETLRMHKKRGGRSMSGELFNNGGSYPPPNPMLSGSTSAGTKKKDSMGGGSGNGPNNKELHMFVWSSSASPVSEGNLRHAVNRAASTDFGTVDPSKYVPHENSVASKAVTELIENMSPRERDVEIEEAVKSPYISQKKMDLEGGGDVSKNTQMPPASVMTRLILIMVWRKLIRNPNTYSSLIGLVWSLVSFRFHIEMPSIVKGSISILSDAGLGMAMFSLGLFMALQPKLIACGKRVATFSMAVRFLTGPAVIAATSIAIGIRGVLLHVAIVQAALPQGIVPFVFAKEYNLHPNILSTGVIFGMLIALPITILYYVLLGV